MSPKKVLVIGELNVDVLLNDLERMPEIGKEYLADDMTTVMGSSSAIFAANISTLGCDTSFCGTIGKDDYGDLILKELQTKKVNTELIIQNKNTKTGASFILNQGQDRAVITYCGAMDEFNPESIPWETIREFDHVHISNFFIQKNLRPYIGDILERIKKIGPTTSLDLQWDVKEKWDFNFKKNLLFVDVFLPNESELLALTKKETIEEAIQDIRLYSNIIALKRGLSGSKGIQGNKFKEIPAFKMNTFKDAIGAGDSFNAAFIYKFLEGATLEECLTYGNLAGALNTTKAGGTAAFTNKADTEKHFKAILDRVNF